MNCACGTGTVCPHYPTPQERARYCKCGTGDCPRKDHDDRAGASGEVSRPRPERNEFWRHFKGGRLYQVIGHSIDPDGDLNVIYKEANGPLLIPYNQKVSRFIGDYESGVPRFKRADDLKGG